jgi:myo-inositol 2-dehydrogenase/D-chiro-inositol 1-dehydrogenase
MVTIQMKLSGGALALIEVNADSGYGYEVDIEVTGETGRVATDSITSPIVHRPGMRSQAIEPDWLVRFETAYIREAQAWIDSLIAGQAIGPSVWDGFRSQQVAQACVESALSGQPVVLADHEKPALYADHPPRAS